MAQTEHEAVARALQQSWQNKDLNVLDQILADELEWYENPLEEPLRTKQAVLDQWRSDLEKQSDLQISVELLDCIENHGYLHCTAVWKDTDDTVHNFDGLFVTHLNDDQKIAYFNQWNA